MVYLAVKWTHVSLAILSGSVFFVHGLLMLRDSPLRHTVWFRILPHVIDTLLLSSAVLLAWMTGQAPWVLDWLGMKIGVLLAYIFCGAVALKRGPTRSIRAVFFVIALALYAQIVTIALTRNPAGLLGML
jgi:uncharacterized membrane protein SirB2